METNNPKAWAKNTKEFHTRKRFKGDCYNCGGHGHVAMNCTKSDATSGTLLNINQNTKCYRCHRKGHVKSQCWARYYCKHYKGGGKIPSKPPAQKPMKLLTPYPSRNSPSKSFTKYQPSLNPTNSRIKQEIQNAQNIRDNFKNKQDRNLRRQLLNMVDTKDLLTLVNNNYNAINPANADKDNNIQHPRMQQN